MVEHIANLQIDRSRTFSAVGSENFKFTAESGEFIAECPKRFSEKITEDVETTSMGNADLDFVNTV